MGFSPAAKISYDFTRQISGGFEYYGDYGRLCDFESLHYQQQQLFVVTDLNVSPVWEINFGVGLGPTAGTDHLIVKGILGRRFNWGKKISSRIGGASRTGRSLLEEGDGDAEVIGKAAI